ncbi:hypothetical protein [Variovorax ginsengisoli]|uniref:Uncharacterized protein n=1 Tax=Variovorax ginsengisoli TaxID=363844 RepID=A0ABT8S7A4_9BURK|nr:hypothetical protein [Variovorax ginsengisoli]MDN8615513.1 hypothetical protein [Variovorax ginsengisoli]MDO1534683.1 hypothetical protein [Variovorax ginsengisoli]
MRTGMVQQCCKWGLGLLGIFGWGSQALAVTVSLAGFAYSGDAKSIPDRFPYSQRVEASFGKPGVNGLIRRAVAAQPPKDFELDTAELAELKGRDQAITVALVMSGETVSTERFGSYSKLFVQLRAQAMFFDFKTMTVLRAYPFSVAYVDLLDHAPTEDELASRVRTLYLGAGTTPGIVARFNEALGRASLPTQVPRFLQVAQVVVSDEARKALPAALGANPGVAETWVADMLGEAISSRTGVPILPYAKGYAIGQVMSMRIADGSVYELKLPEPDYAIAVDLLRFGRFEHAKVAAGTSYIYASKAQLKIQQPLSGRVYLDSEFKNGEVKTVPASQQTVDDFPAYSDSLRGLFTKLSNVLAGSAEPWLKDAAANTDIDKQITATKEVLDQCK